MKRQEKLVLLIVALLAFSRLGALAKETYMANHYGASRLPPYDQSFWIEVSRLLGLLVNFGAAIWLTVEAKAAALKWWIWALFGLFFGVLGVALFYLVQLYTRKHAAETPNQLPDPTSPSVTPPAGAGGAPSVAADH